MTANKVVSAVACYILRPSLSPVFSMLEYARVKAQLKSSGHTGSASFSLNHSMFVLVKHRLPVGLPVDSVFGSP